MKTLEKLLIYLFCCVSSHLAFSQNITKEEVNILEIPIKFGETTIEELQTSPPATFQDAEAVVLCDLGVQKFYRSYTILERKIKIKIFKKSGYSWANITIPLYTSSNPDENDVLTAVEANTYNLENGKISQTTLAKAEIYYKPINENYKEAFFILPNVKEGSIIEISYSHESKKLSNFNHWIFQKSIPTLWSVYRLDMYPGTFSFKTISRGEFPFEAEEKYNSKENDLLVQHLRWVVKDAPPIIDEPFVANKNDYATQVLFEISGYGTLSISSSKISLKQTSISETWLDLRNTLLNDADFGGSLKKFSNFNIKEALGKSPKERVELAFKHISQNIKWDGSERLFAEKSLKNVYQDQQGNSAEINLCLISLLKELKITTSPVILSTRSHGKLSEQPLIRMFNYVVAAVFIDKDTLLLDATESDIPLGILPTRCLNEKGFLLTTNPSWIEIKPKADFTKKWMVDAVLNEKGELKGLLKLSGEGYFGIELKNMLQKDKLETFIKEFQEQYPFLTNIELESVNRELAEVSIKFTMEEFAKVVKNQLYFNPICFSQVKTNPFKGFIRQNPIDFITPSKYLYSIAISLPKGFSLQTVPKNTLNELPKETLSFSYNFDKTSENTIKIENKLLINQATFEAKWFGQFRDFYDTVVSKQSELVSIRK